MSIELPSNTPQYQTEEEARRDDVVSAEALQHYGLSAQVEHELISLSENATYLVNDPGTGRTGVLRVHRQDYHPLRAIQSELDWITAVRRDTDVATNIVIPTEAGDRVYVTNIDGVERYAVMFEVMPGIEPDHTVLHATSFETLGKITGQLHQHAKTWEPPAGFQRFSWDWEHTLGKTPRWGKWEDGFSVTPDDVEMFGKAAELIRQRLEAFGKGPNRFGLTHADLRLANLLVEGESVNVIDFDDCGYAWYLYDFGAAVSFIEDDPRVPEWQSAWVEGYRSVAELSAEDEEMLATFVLLRRLLLVAWMGSHSHSRECQEQGDSFTVNTRPLVRRYLESNGSSIN
ncbi:phosphotransferase [Brevibacterium sp. p3-SID960]|uniref:phosphotransferase enzyme family protein n=1 Tax=Brevibacterium sp. p3-SID960 TaxID=2916063 RepID=UPI0021A485CE|nr:phosphotransferase [Brevibacterium sp. p3-SID960]MCT1689773.1 phosphotransferase [Brevibacterium sp. p3-SID960]